MAKQRMISPGSGTKKGKSSRVYVADDFRHRWYGPYHKDQAKRVRNRLKIAADADLESGTNVTFVPYSDVHGPNSPEGPSTHFGGDWKKGDARVVSKKKERK